MKGGVEESVDGACFSVLDGRTGSAGARDREGGGLGLGCGGSREEEPLLTDEPEKL